MLGIIVVFIIITVFCVCVILFGSKFRWRIHSSSSISSISIVVLIRPIQSCSQEPNNHSRLPVYGLEEPLCKSPQLGHRCLTLVLQPPILLSQSSHGMLQRSPSSLFAHYLVLQFGQRCARCVGGRLPDGGTLVHVVRV